MAAGGRALEREQLAAQLWPRASSRTARHALRQLLYRLRGVGASIVLEPERVRLPTAQLTDTIDLAVALDAPPIALDAALRDALARCDPKLGPWLPDYAPSLSPAFDGWLDATRAQAEARLRRALEAMLATDAASDVAQRERVATTLLSLDPLNRHARAALRASEVDGDVRQPATRWEHDGPEVRLQQSSAGVGRWRAPASRWPPSSAPTRPANARMSDVSGEALAASTGEGSVLRALLRRVARAGASVVCVDSFTPATSASPPSARLVARLLDAPGALGCSPAALASLRDWMARSFAASRGGDERQPTLPEEDLRELLDAVCDEAPLVVVLESDTRTSTAWELFGALSRLADHRRMLVLAAAVSARPAAAHDPDRS